MSPRAKRRMFFRKYSPPTVERFNLGTILPKPIGKEQEPKMIDICRREIDRDRQEGTRGLDGISKTVPGRDTRAEDLRSKVSKTETAGGHIETRERGGRTARSFRAGTALRRAAALFLGPGRRTSTGTRSSVRRFRGVLRFSWCP